MSATAAPVHAIETSARVRPADAAAVAGICLAYTLSRLILGGTLGNQYGFPLGDSYITQALARRDGFALSTRFALAATPALCGNFIWLAPIGMEHLLFVVLVLACIRLWQDDRLVLVGACAGLLALTRPEAVAFGLFLALVTSWRERRLIPALPILAGWSIGVAILFAADLYLSGSLMPTTQQSRSWLWFHENSKHSSLTLVHFLVSYPYRLRLQFPLMTSAPVRLSIQMLSLFATFLTGIIWLMRQRRQGVNLLLALASIHFSAFLLAFPVIGHAGRYQPLFLFLMFPGLFFGVAALVRRRAASVLVILAGILSLTMWRIVAVESIGHINGTHARAPHRGYSKILPQTPLSQPSTLEESATKEAAPSSTSAVSSTHPIFHISNRAAPPRMSQPNMPTS